MRAATYARLSLAKVDQESTTRQEQACRQHAAARGWDVTYAYSDVDLSAYRRGVVRPGFEALVEHAERGEVDVIVCWKLDRLVRNFADFERLWSVCEANGVQLAAVMEPIDTSTEIGMMVVRLIVGMARMESANTGARVKAARADAARQGRPPSPGRRAFGLTLDWTELVPAEADAIRWAADAVLAGQSAYAVGQRWNADGLISPSGNPWRSATVVQCLRAPRLAGRRIYEGRVVADGQWPAILDGDTFDRLVTVLADPRRRKGGGGPARHLLTGILRCHCGTSMGIRPKADGTRRYLCRRDIGGCGAGIHADHAERHVIDMVFEFIVSGELERALDEVDTDGVLAAIRADEAQLVSLATDHAQNRIGRTEWLAARDVVEGRLDALRRQAARWSPQVQGLTRGEWESYDLPAKRGALRLVLDSVTVGPSVRGGFDPERLDPVWRV